MASIQQKELRNDAGGVLRRVEAGEELVVTVAGRPAARLVPIHKRQWVSGQALRSVWATPAPRSLETDLESFPDDALADPFGR